MIPANSIRRIEWRLTRPSQINRFGYSGRRQVVANPWHGKWEATVEIVPLGGAARVREWQAFLASLKGQIGTFQLPATEAAQHSGGNPTLTANANAGATSATLSDAPIYGPEQVANGDFSAGTAGWTAVASSLSASGGRFSVEATAASGAAAVQTLTGLTIGATYRLHIGHMDHPGGFARVSIGDPGVAYVVQRFRIEHGVSTAVDFVATKSTLEVLLEVASSATWGAVGSVATFENISVRRQTGTGPVAFTPGMMATFIFPSGNRQLVTVVAASGSAITFEPPLRETVASGTAIETVNPYALVAMKNPDALTWSADPGRIYGIAPFDVEEAF